MTDAPNMTEAEEYRALQTLLLRRFTEALQAEGEPKASMLAAAARFLSEARAQGQLPPTMPPIDTRKLPFQASDEGEEKAAAAKSKPAKSLADVARGLPFATVTSGSD